MNDAEVIKATELYQKVNSDFFLQVRCKNSLAHSSQLLLLTVQGLDDFHQIIAVQRFQENIVFIAQMHDKLTDRQGCGLSTYI